ncbi:MAG: transposase [Deltaproteobacteria bacterium]|nr:transposase [Deltaproteobacteria bacterium]
MSDKSFSVPCRAERRRAARCKPVNRQQLLLRSVDVEKLVEEDHPVRAIWELVEQLDLEPFYETIEAIEGEAGRSAWDPRVLISLWLYAYSRAVSSGREISRRCGYEPAYQWLTGLEVINHHTLSDFRVQHGQALDELFVQVLGVLSHEGLITLERVMHDGVKVEAGASGGAGEERAFGVGFARAETYASGPVRPGEAAESPGEHDRSGGSDHAAAWRGVCAQL